MPVTFKVIQGGRSVKVFTVHEGESRIIGRSKTSDISISDPLLSRRHMRVDIAESAFTVTDLKSSNGTFLNGERITESALKAGDEIKIGQTILEVTTEAPVPATAAHPAALAGEPVVDHNLRFCSKCYRAVSADELSSDELGFAEGRFICAECQAGKAFDPNIIEGFKIIDKLGEGKLGSVYKAKHLALDKYVAVKIVVPERTVNQKTLQTFMREAKIGGQLYHPNIIEMYDAAESNGVYYITMEYVDGPTVEQKVESSGPLSLKDAINIITRVSEALEYAHGSNIIHRNVRPANIMISRRSQVKLTDFGLAKSLEDTDSAGITMPGEGKGTLFYTAPEQISDARTADHRSDIYSLGATLYFMLTGRPPFVAPTIGMTMRRIVQGDLDPIMDFNPNVPKGIWEIIQKAMDRDPQKRFQSVSQFLWHLKRGSPS
jgi:hypothetical protein